MPFLDWSVSCAVLLANALLNLLRHPLSFLVFRVANVLCLFS
jgi:hypothetical protein